MKKRLLGILVVICTLVVVGVGGCSDTSENASSVLKGFSGPDAAPTHVTRPVWLDKTEAQRRFESAALVILANPSGSFLIMKPIFEDRNFSEWHATDSALRKDISQRDIKGGLALVYLLKGGPGEERLSRLTFLLEEYGIQQVTLVQGITGDESSSKDDR